MIARSNCWLDTDKEELRKWRADGLFLVSFYETERVEQLQQRYQTIAIADGSY